MNSTKMIQHTSRAPSSSSHPHYTYPDSSHHITSSPFYSEEGYRYSDQHLSAFNSPTLSATHPSLSYHHPPNTHFDKHESMGLGIQYPAQTHPASLYYLTDCQVYSNSPNSLTSDLPMTPKSTDSDFGGKRGYKTQSENANMPKLKTQKPRKPRKPRPVKASTNKLAKLSAPLSELTKHMKDIPVRNMKEYVNRSIEVRRREVETRNGYVTRPMNSFMLYRSAYAERTKVWCVHNNHQVVSAVTGESWPLESNELRQMYIDLANEERINHAAANPTYKFSPSKAVSPPRKRKDSYTTDEEGGFHSDESDHDYIPQGRHQGLHTAQRRKRALTPASTDGGSPCGGYISLQDVNRSQWEAIPEGKPLPAAIGSQGMYQQYFEATMHSNNVAGIEDIRMRNVDASRLEYARIPSGLPGAQHAELLRRSAPISSGQVDPLLLAHYEPTCEMDSRLLPASDAMNTISPTSRYVIEGQPMYGHFCETDNSASHFDDWMGVHQNSN